MAKSKTAAPSKAKAARGSSAKAARGGGGAAAAAAAAAASPERGGGGGGGGGSLSGPAKDVARVPDVYQSFFQLLAQRRVMSAAEATQCIEDCAAVPGMAKTVHGTPDVADAIARLNVALKPIMLEIKSMLDEGVTYHGLVNNTPDALAKKHGSKLSPGEAELFKKIVAAIAAAGAGSENPAAFEASTDELERLRGDLTQSAYREFIGRLRGAMWLTMGPTGGLAFGIRTKLELSTLLETHGVPLPQYIYH